jgi:hypothetical protein
MAYSYTQIAHYLGCPRRYQHRYVAGWKERDTRSGLLFGRAFEIALASLFRGEDATAVLLREWSPAQQMAVEYTRGDTWDRMLGQGTKLLELFAQYDRVRIQNPLEDLQIKLTRELPGHREFVAYIDAIGHLDGIPCVIDWKTTSVRYPEEPKGLLALDPQLICYSWITGLANVAFVVFVRKRLPEIQYLKAEITDQQRAEFGEMVEQTIDSIESGVFHCRSGIRFPQNGCVTCSYLGLCLGNNDLTDRNLIQRPGEDLGWIDELPY